jgi:DNA-binding transcriptional regulator GbsR (MarR family)
VKICDKVFQAKRKAFDSKKKRVIDSEHATLLRRSELEEKKKSKIAQNVKNGKPKWKRQSDELRSVLKMNNTCSSGFGMGKILI